jgi:hypothetical protein
MKREGADDLPLSFRPLQPPRRRDCDVAFLFSPFPERTDHARDLLACAIGAHRPQIDDLPQVVDGDLYDLNVLTV